MDSLPRIKNILKNLGVKPERIELDTTIQSLKFIPEDIEDFLTSYEKEFNIDMVEFIYTDYFEEEIPLIYFVVEQIGKMVNTQNKNAEIKIDITIKHLLDVVKEGKWFKPV